MTIQFSNITTEEHEKIYELINHLLTNYKTNRIIPALNYTKKQMILMHMSTTDLLINYYPKKLPRTILKLAQDVDDYHSFINLPAEKHKRFIKYIDKATENYYEKSKL